jgi:DNA repair protein RadC
VLFVLLRDVKKQLLHKEIIGRGILNRLLIHPREIFSPAIRHRAHSLIVAHNHPSGDPEPSEEDRKATELLRQSGAILGIELTDHLIIGKQGRFFSFREKGLLGPISRY